MSKRNLIWLIVIAAAAVLGALLARPLSPSGDLPGTEPSLAEQVRKLIRKKYYQAIPGQALECGAIRGMVESLDEFSSYIPPKKVHAFQQRIAGKAFGLGLCVDRVDGHVCVVGPLANSPAHHAGLIAGDRILSINGKSLKGLAIEEVRHRLNLTGKASVLLTLLRAGQKRGPIRLNPRPFCLETVTGLFRDERGTWVYAIDPLEDIAYLRVNEFTPETLTQFQQAFRQMTALAGVVLDLRNNPGGARSAAIALADLFLRKGTIVVIEHRSESTERHLAHDTGTVPDVPMVVLIDSRTASAAELVAGSLQAGGRAVLVGERTRGKGCIQTMFPLGDTLGQINLTTGWFHFGLDRPIMRLAGATQWGIDPNVPLAMDTVQRAAWDAWVAREAVLPSPNATTQPASSALSASDDLRRAQLLALDPHLVRALDLFRSPGRIERILKRAAARRDAQAQTQKATQPE